MNYTLFFHHNYGKLGISYDKICAKVSRHFYISGLEKKSFGVFLTIVNYSIFVFLFSKILALGKDLKREVVH